LTKKKINLTSTDPWAKCCIDAFVKLAELFWCAGRKAILGPGNTVKYYFESHYTQLKLKRHRKCTSVQNSEDYKTQMLILLGEITFVIGPDCIFVNLWGACDSSVLQCAKIVNQWALAEVPKTLW
jgi:hypothetical protein